MCLTCTVIVILLTGTEVFTSCDEGFIKGRYTVHILYKRI